MNALINAPPPLLYRALVCILAPLIIAHLVLKSVRDGGSRYFRQRLGLDVSDATNQTVNSPPPRWIHAASVGEVITILPLVEALLKAEPHIPVLLTTNTPTGAAVLQKHALPGVRHVYLPIDWHGASLRFLKREKPISAWIVETEIWPWLYANCHDNGIPVSIINARLSPRTQRIEHGKLATTWRHALATVTVHARSAADRDNFVRLGALLEQCQVVGDLKFADNKTSEHSAPLINTPYCVAASTHEDEELQLARAWLESDCSTLLVVVPRHVERSDQILRQLQALQSDTGSEPTATGNVPIGRRSKQEKPHAKARLYLGDTLGELQSWYASAEAVFVGGSLVAKGGHNILEPARHGKLIVVGPNMQNFVEAMQLLGDNNAIVTARNATDAVAQLQRALMDSDWAMATGARARAVSMQSVDVVERYLLALGVITE